MAACERQTVREQFENTKTEFGRSYKGDENRVLGWEMFFEFDPFKASFDDDDYDENTKLDSSLKTERRRL